MRIIRKKKAFRIKGTNILHVFDESPVRDAGKIRRAKEREKLYRDAEERKRKRDWNEKLKKEKARMRRNELARKRYAKKKSEQAKAA